MSVHEIKRASLLNVPAKLRQLAEEIEKRADGAEYSVIAVIGYPTGHVAVRGFGSRTDSLSCSGWLARAQTLMTEGAAADADNFSPAS